MGLVSVVSKLKNMYQTCSESYLLLMLYIDLIKERKKKKKKEEKIMRGGEESIPGFEPLTSSLGDL